MAYLSDFTSTSIGTNRILPRSKFELELILILTLVLVLISHKEILIHKTTLDELVLVLSKIKSGEYLPYAIDSIHTPLGVCLVVCLGI